MKDKIKTFGLLALVAIALSFLPIWLLLVEGREFTQTGESLYQEWKLVSMSEYFGYARYAQTAWMDSTRVVYTLLALIHSLVLLTFSSYVARGIQKILQRKKG